MKITNYRIIKKVNLQKALRTIGVDRTMQQIDDHLRKEGGEEILLDQMKVVWRSSDEGYVVQLVVNG